MLDHNPDDEICREDVHGWFELTYSNYRVLHRSILQSMPGEWQHRFVEIMEELDNAVMVAMQNGLEMPVICQITWRDDDGKYMEDPIPHYNRGRTIIEEIAGQFHD